LDEGVTTPENGRGSDVELSWEKLAEFTVASEPGNERRAMEDVAEVIGPLGLSDGRLQQLKTAVAEATMNAMEHGNKYQAETPVQIEVLKSDVSVAVRIIDEGGGQQTNESAAPDLEAKLAGEQSPRGWGLFLIQNMVDELNISDDSAQHTIELIMNLEEKE
jgi:anti-sigma regulatory factor (Ser/Thr protein kinase)